MTLRKALGGGTDDAKLETTRSRGTMMLVVAVLLLAAAVGRGGGATGDCVAVDDGGT